MIMTVYDDSDGSEICELDTKKVHGFYQEGQHIYAVFKFESEELKKLSIYKGEDAAEKFRTLCQMLKVFDGLDVVTTSSRDWGLMKVVKTEKGFTVSMDDEDYSNIQRKRRELYRS